MTKTFFRYVIPSMLAFALSGVYAIVDGFFVGNTLGDQGLAAINIAYPVTAFILAIGTGIGMGGAIQYAIYDGARQIQSRNRYFWISVGCLISITILVMIVFIPFNEPILKLFGAEGLLLSYGKEYLHYILLGAFFQIMATGLVPFIRNMNGSVQAMLAMIGGFVTNIILDYLLVWVYSMGMKGAAVATVLGQGVTMICCIFFFYRRRQHLYAKWNADWKYQVTKIFTSAISPFGLTFIPNLTLIFINKSAIVTGGNVAVSEYAIISYAVCVVLLLLQGVSDGAQPLISLHYGRNELYESQKIRNLAYIASTVTAALCIGLGYAFRYQIGYLFGASEEVVILFAQDFIIFLIGFLFVGISRTTLSYFYATEKNLYAYLLIYCEPLFLLVYVCILPLIWGILGTWLATPLSQFSILVMSLVLSVHVSKQTQVNKN